MEEGNEISGKIGFFSLAPADELSRFILADCGFYGKGFFFETSCWVYAERGMRSNASH